MSEPDVTLPPRLDSAVARARRWGTRGVGAVVAVVGLAWLLRVYAGIQVNRWWFASLDHGSVYTTILRTQVLLFVMFGVVAALASGLAVALVARTASGVVADPESQTWRHRFQRRPLAGRALLALAVVVPMILLGRRAAGHWQAWQLWRHAASWGVTDPTFHRDVSYYVAVYPWHRLVVNLLSSCVVWAAVATLIAAYLYGAARVRGEGPVLSRRVQAQLSALGAVWLVLKAFGFWLDRYALVTSQRGTVTGPSYTDLHAVLPGKTIMIVLSLLVAGLLVANVVIKRLRLLALGVAVMVAASAVIGSLWPALTMRLREQPSAATLELTHIAHNQKATLDAFGLSGRVETTRYDAQEPLTGSALQQQARATQVRVLDPNHLSPTFSVKQQLQAYYGFKNHLDVDRYRLGGQLQDVAIGVRELNLAGIARNSWANRHLVYTHGYGVVAAPTDHMQSDGTPSFTSLDVQQPQVYFGQHSPSFSVVGQPAGSSTNLEFDHPGTDGRPTHTTYTGGGGVAIGSAYRRAMFAINLGDPNLLLSRELTSGSRILTVRDPQQRVSAIAPWLTLDGDAYPAVVDGRIEWIVDGYTASANYPDSQLVDLHSSTADQPHRSVNYLRNSVKATVDAYTGEVHLYEWNTDAQPDPLLRTWESAFPGLVEPQSAMSASLLAHVRYPHDLFDVQRSLLTRYHVQDAADFYSGNDTWAVPTDPTVAATRQLNAGTYTPGARTPNQEPVYMSLAPTGFGAASYALSTPLVTLNRHELAAFLAVDSTPGPDYGRFTLTEFPAGSAVESPAQVQNDFESDTEISEALTLQRGGNSSVVLGNLLAVPLGGKMLYVEPVYTQASGGNSFPVLRHVIAMYGDGKSAFETTLDAALTKALASSSS